MGSPSGGVGGGSNSGSSGSDSSDNDGAGSGGGGSGGTSSSGGGTSSSGGGSDSTSGSSSHGGGSDSGGSDRSGSRSDFDRSVADAGPPESGPDPSDDNDDSQRSDDDSRRSDDRSRSSDDDSRRSDDDDDDSGASNRSDTPSTDTGLTADQSRSLAETAAVMDGYAFSPPDVASAANDDAEEDEGVVDRAVDAVTGTAALAGGVVVGAADTVVDAAVETVSMVNDAAGTVLDAAVGWTGLDVFEGHAERNAARGQAIVDAVSSPIETARGVASSVEEGWETFEDNWENERYFDAGRQIGSVGIEAAAVAVPASRVGALGRVDDVVPDTTAGRGATPDLDGVRRDIEAVGAEVLTDADPDVRAYLDDAARRQGLEPDELQASTLGDTIMVRDDLKDDIVTLREELEHVRQQQDGRVAVGADGYDTRVDLEIEARENMLQGDDLTAAQRDQIQQEIDTIREQGRY